MLGLSYWFLPLFAGCVWLGTLLGMLGYWISQGSPNYPWESPGEHLAYISDIGATAVGTDIFIPGSTVCVVVFDIAFISERWLRHKGRLTHNYRTSEKILSGFAILFAVIGAAGLITLTICNTRHYHTVHDTMLCVFMYVVPFARMQFRGSMLTSSTVLATSSLQSSSAPSISAWVSITANTASFE